MRTIDLSDSDFDTLMKWIGQRSGGIRRSSLRAENLERRAILVLKKIHKRYGTE